MKATFSAKTREMMFSESSSHKSKDQKWELKLEERDFDSFIPLQGLDFLKKSFEFLHQNFCCQTILKKV